jgi:nucleotide-binding universal stress UspA family protein
VNANGTDGSGGSADARNTPPLNVVVPLDGSPRAERALGCAQALTGHVGGALILAGSADHDEDYDETVSYLDTVLADEVSERVVLPRLTLAEAVDTIARRRSPSIVCIASRGRSGRQAAILGSVLAELLTRGAAPVLVVGPAAEWSSESTCNALVACVDEPFGSVHALQQAAPIAEMLDLPLQVATIVGASSEADASIARTQVQLDDAAIEVAGIEALTGEDPAELLLRRGSEPGTILLLEALGLSRTQRLVKGSVALDVIRRSKGPTLALPPHRPPRGWRA